MKIAHLMQRATLWKANDLINKMSGTRMELMET